VDHVKEQKIKDLEILVQDYKTLTRKLEKEVEELSKRPAAVPKQGSHLQGLKDELAKERQALEDAQKGLHHRLWLSGRTLIHCVQH